MRRISASSALQPGEDFTYLYNSFELQTQITLLIPTYTLEDPATTSAMAN